MFEHDTEQEARRKILQQVKAYCDTFHKQREYKKGDRIAYASRIYDSAEMCSLADAALDFWLTAGRYTQMFEEKFARYLGITISLTPYLYVSLELFCASLPAAST